VTSSNWARLDWLVSEERQTVDPASFGVGTVFHYSIPVVDELGDGRLEAAETIDSGKMLLSGGEVLISKLNPRLPRVLKANRHDVPTVASTEFVALKPGADVEDRFLCYWLTSESVRQYLDGATMSVTRSHQRVRPDLLTKMWVRFPSRSKQRAIADFLDAETARIDALIAKKRRLAARLDERRSGQIELAIRGLAATWGEVPLKFIVDDVTVGIVVTPAAWYVERGVPAPRGVNVRPGEILTENMVHISEEGHALHLKSSLHSGDVVVVRTGQAGVAAVVPPSLGRANCIDLIVIRPGKRVDSRFLEFVLNSDWTRKHVDENSVGTIQTHFNVAAMKIVPIPNAPRDQQQIVIDHLTNLTREIDETVDRLMRQITLLQERRQGLITAAVTGEMEIPGAAT
jgi:type I restriction enzyme S subunit